MERMEKRIMANVCRYFVIIIALSFAASAAHAQLTNPGFETAGTNYVFPDTGDGAFPLITNTFAAGWLPNGGAYVARTATNTPAQGTYEDSATGYDFVGVNQSGSTNTARTGGYALRTFGPFPGFCCVGSGASQLISSNTVAAVSNNSIWVVSGYGLNWSGDPLQDFGLNVTGFGVLQVAFYDVTNALIGAAIDSPHLDTGTVQNAWISCSVTGTAPPGTVSVGAWALHVGMNGALGSIFWDDMSITNIGVAPPPPPIVTNLVDATILGGNQACWPTVVNASYQPQFSDNNSTWTSIGTLIPGDGTTNCVFGFSHKFYRVLQSQ